MKAENFQKHEDSSERRNESFLKNPNSIGQLISLAKDLPTSPDKVYRTVNASGADDLFESGIVRNEYAAGKGDQKRWGEKIFWSRGEEGKYHAVTKNGYVIEAPYDIASVRAVKLEEITAVYTKLEDKIENVLIARREKQQRDIIQKKEAVEERDKTRIDQLKKELGM
jgi:hypothetical protein